MAVATQEVFSHSHLDGESELWNVGAATPQYTLVEQDGRYGVTLTNTAGITDRRVKSLGPYEFSAPTFAGVGNEDATAIGEFATGVSTHGTWEFEGITGATVNTPQGTGVFITGAGALTLTEGSNARVGAVNYPATYAKTAGTLPVKIGA